MREDTGLKKIEMEMDHSPINQNFELNKSRQKFQLERASQN